MMRLSNHAVHEGGLVVIAQFGGGLIAAAVSETQDAQYEVRGGHQTVEEDDVARDAWHHEEFVRAVHHPGHEQHDRLANGGAGDEHGNEEQFVFEVEAARFDHIPAGENYVDAENDHERASGVARAFEVE